MSQIIFLYYRVCIRSFAELYLLPTSRIRGALQPFKSSGLSIRPAPMPGSSGRGSRRSRAGRSCRDDM